MKSHEIRDSFLDFFPERGHRLCPAPRWCRTAIRPCCSPTPAWCSSRTSSWAWSEPPAPRAVTCRSACAYPASTTTSRTSGPARATTPSSRCSATSRSATTSSRRRSPSAGSWSPACWGIAAGAPVGHRLPGGRRGVRRSGDELTGLPAGAHPALRREGQLLGDGRHRPVRSVQRDPRRLAARTRPPVGWAGGDRVRPLPGDLEPGLHAVHARRDGDAHAAAQAGVDTGMGLERVAAVLQGVDSTTTPTCSVRSSRRRPTLAGASLRRRPRRPTSRCA